MRFSGSRAELTAAVEVRSGDTGQLATPCVPRGVGCFSGRMVEVVSDGRFIPAGADVTVTSVAGGRVEVAPAETLLL